MPTDAARVAGALAAPVVVGVPEKGPWLVGPVRSLLTLGGCGPGVGMMAEIWESGPNLVARVWPEAALLAVMLVAPV